MTSSTPGNIEEAVRQVGSAFVQENDVKQVPVADIHIPDDRRRPDDEVGRMAESMDHCGMINPVTVDQNKNVAAGVVRVQAAILLGWETLPVIQRTLTAEESLEIHLSNEYRRPQTVPDHIENMGRLKGKSMNPSTHPHDTEERQAHPAEESRRKWH